jgi:hypothetical protein
MKLLNRALGAGERIEYMGWVHEGVVSAAAPWQTYRPKFLLLKGTDVMLYDTPPVSAYTPYTRITRYKTSSSAYRLSVLYIRKMGYNSPRGSLTTATAPGIKALTYLPELGRSPYNHHESFGERGA